jgi:hypothetical protein
VTEVRCADWAGAFTVLDREGFEVQAGGQGVLRVTGHAADVQKALAAGRIEEAAVNTVGANLEEAFVAIVSGPADISGPADSSPAVA